MTSTDRNPKSSPSSPKRTLAQWTPTSREAATTYNATTTHEQVLADLMSAGWTVERGTLPEAMTLLAPGQTGGRGEASLGGADKNGKPRRPSVHVFGSSNSVLPGPATYSPFDVVALTRFEGNAAAAADSLIASGAVTIAPPPIPTDAKLTIVDLQAADTRDIANQIVTAIRAARQADGLPMFAQVVARTPDGGTTVTRLITPRIHDRQINWDITETDQVIFRACQPIRGWQKLESGAKVPNRTSTIERTILGLVTKILWAPDAGLAQVEAITHEPRLLPDGRVLKEPGFYAADRVLVSIPKDAWPAWHANYHVPATPTLEQVRAAAGFVDAELLSDFAFSTDGDRVTAFGWLLTCATRHLMSTCVTYVFSAALPGSGKSFLSMLGQTAACSYPKSTPFVLRNVEEDDSIERQALTAFRSSPSGPYFLQDDDAKRGVTFNSSSLRKLVSAPDGSLIIRALHRNDGDAIGQIITVVCGNNVTPSRDSVRRVERIEIGKRARGFAWRHGAGGSLGWLVANRPSVLAALHTIAAFALQNPAAYEPLPSFETWSRIVSGSLAHLEWRGTNGEAIHQAHRDALEASEDADVSDQWGEFVAFWSRTFGERGVTVAQLVDAFDALQDADKPRLPDALIYRAAHTPDATSKARSWGRALAGQERVPVEVDGAHFAFRVVGKTHGTKIFSLSKEGQAPVEPNEAATSTEPSAWAAYVQQQRAEASSLPEARTLPPVTPATETIEVL